MTAIGRIAPSTVAVILILGFMALGVLTALSAAAPVGIAFVEVIIIGTVACIVVAELQPAFAQHRAARATERLAVREFRLALDELPETQHPLGL
jgi:hypothetical protein